MISILIPVMNYDCSALVDDLYVQAERLRIGAGVDYEIIVGDDASTDVQQRSMQQAALPVCL